MSLAALRTAFSQSGSRSGTALSPFLVLGDPTPELSPALAAAAVAAGADMLEIGFPYSDPVADGPEVQAAAQRALAAGVSTRAGFRVLGEVAAACPGIPLNLLVYGNLVHRIGYEAFAAETAAAGASSLLAPDIPLEEGGPLRRACRRAGVGHVELAGPLTPPDRLRRLADVSAFVYLAGFQGVTGVRRRGFAEVLARTEAARDTLDGTDTPLCLGFGISTAAQVARAGGAGARIAVVGSHLARVIRRLYRGPKDAEDVVSGFGDAVRRLASGRFAC